MIRINDNYLKLKASYLFPTLPSGYPPTSSANPTGP